MPPRSPDLPSARVEAELRRRVEAGEWESGEALPAVNQLANEYGVSSRSVAKALHRMAADDLVRIVPRWGTFKT